MQADTLDVEIRIAELRIVVLQKGAIEPGPVQHKVSFSKARLARGKHIVPGPELNHRRLAADGSELLGSGILLDPLQDARAMLIARRLDDPGQLTGGVEPGELKEDAVVFLIAGNVVLPGDR